MRLVSCLLPDRSTLLAGQIVTQRLRTTDKLVFDTNRFVFELSSCRDGLVFEVHDIVDDATHYLRDFVFDAVEIVHYP